MAAKRLRILSWNVNGLRACVKKGFGTWLARCGGDIVGLQEVRALPADLPPELTSPKGWHTHFNPAERLGYSGVALYSREKPDAIETSLGDPRFDSEGRLQIARFGRLCVVNGYFPKGSGKERDNSRVPYKLEFYASVFARMESLRKRGLRVLVMGDLNTAHREIDLARPKENQKTSGFLPEERAELDRWEKAGWIDTFRSLHPDAPEHYTWWTQRAGARERNIGWRIDGVWASAAAAKHLLSAYIRPEVKGSDHCPVGVDLAREVLG